MTNFPRHYSLIDVPVRRDSYFRVRSGGYFDRYDAPTKTWTETDDKRLRDYYSRAIENGEAVPTTSEEAEHS